MRDTERLTNENEPAFVSFPAAVFFRHRLSPFRCRKITVASPTWRHIAAKLRLAERWLTRRQAAMDVKADAGAFCL